MLNNIIVNLLSNGPMFAIAVATFWLQYKASKRIETSMNEPPTDKTRTMHTGHSVRSNVGLISLLIALCNLALLCFGPEKAALITTGTAASIALSLVLAFSGGMLLRY